MNLISVIIPAYNAGPYLKAAAQSARAEKIEGLELIVVDDGSSDNSLAALKSWPIKVVSQKNKGEAGARNAGLGAASGRYISFLDADDLLISGSLRERIAFLEENPLESIVGGLPSALINERGEKIADVFQRMSRRYSFPFRLTSDFYRSGHFFPVSSSLYVYRREVFDLIGNYDEALRVATDCDFHFRALRSVSIPILKLAAFERRLHSNNLSVGSRGDGELRFHSGLTDVLQKINRKYGFNSGEIIPWEVEYLRADVRA